jgi:hypothetical protein
MRGLQTTTPPASDPAAASRERGRQAAATVLRDVRRAVVDGDLMHDVCRDLWPDVVARKVLLQAIQAELRNALRRP